MKMKECRLLAASALRSAVFASVTFALAGPAWAQTAGDPQEKSKQAEGKPGVVAPGTNSGTTPADEEPMRDELDPKASDKDTILVTGSRIPRPQFEGNFPGAQVTAEQIEQRGFTSLFDVLNELPIMSESGANPYLPGGNGNLPASLGISFSNMMNLGPGRTLTLVNGRRFVSGNTATSFGPGGATGSPVDTSVIPVSLIAGVDILAAGGAAQYGSDAIGGVINIRLKDNFDGVTISAVNAITHEGDLPSQKVAALAGKNFAGGRGNISASAEYTYWNTVLNSARSEYRGQYLGTQPNVFNGTRRNPNFAPALNIDPLVNGPFLNPLTDGQTQQFFLKNRGLSAGSVFLSDGGTIFLPSNAAVASRQNIQGLQVNAANPAIPSQNRPVPFGIIPAGNQIIPYAPSTANICGPNVPGFCLFAPALTSGPNGFQLPNGLNSAVAVINRYAPGFTLPAGTTQSQANQLAVYLLQANLPTIGEYFSANPNLDVNLIAALTAPFGTAFGSAASPVSVLPTVPNTDPATLALFSRVARPLRFDDNGNLTTFALARPQANEYAGVYGNAVGGDFLRNDDQNFLRVQQEKKIATLFAHFDVTDNITVYTENLYADVSTVSPRRLDLPNNVSNNGTELTGLIMNFNNPFLDAGDRAALRSVGICPTPVAEPGKPAPPPITIDSPCKSANFMLSRTNVDINTGTPQTNRGETIRNLFGVKGDFGLLGRSWSFDIAGGLGRVDSVATGGQIRDIEYALAVDAVDEGLVKTGVANGVIRCRSQVSGQVGLPPGVQGREFARIRDAQGRYVETLVDRAVTPEMIAACAPLNVFGYNQMSQAAKEYVRYQTETRNLAKQYIAEASISGSLFDLPAGPLGVAAVAEWRSESFDFQVDPLSRIGGARTLAFANTSGTVRTTEFGGEARIPIFGEGFTLPLFQSLAILPAVRFYRATGSAPDIVRLNGDVDEQRYESDLSTIWSLSGTWQPIKALNLRASYTRSIRAPSVVELFLGGQPQFVQNVGDLCSITQIDIGTNAATRRANCEAAVVAAGIAGNTAGAKQFLAQYNPPPQTLYGSLSGSLSIEPETGTSWAVGAVFKPSFIPGLLLSADLISATVRDQISSYTLPTALFGCYDSPSFPDTTKDVGINWCDQFVRNGADSATPFTLTNGFTEGYRNLGAINNKQIAVNANYNLKLTEIFNASSNLGNLNLSASASHQLVYRTSQNNEFDPALEGIVWFKQDAFLPKWKLFLSVNYKLGIAHVGWTTSWQSGTPIFSDSSPDDVPEQVDVYRKPSYSLHNANFGFQLPGKQSMGLNFNISNVFNKKYLLSEAAAFGVPSTGLVSAIGRQYNVALNLKF
jgi:outer membrane receptor protein involved in Fe transport